MLKRVFSWLLVPLAALYLLAYFSPGFQYDRHAVHNLDWYNIAHRGGPGLAPEHTLLAYRTAFENGATALELDVQSTSDDVLVLLHDDTLDRTTTGSGPVQQLTLAQLKMLDAGKGELVPTLDEVFSAHPNVPYIIELKQQQPLIAKPLCDMIRKHNLQQKVIVGSFGAEPLEAFRQDCPEVATGMAQSEVVSYLVLYWLGLEHWHWINAQAMQLPPEQSGITLLTESFVARAQARNLLIQAWTINETEQINALLKVGVDGIITDYPNRVPVR
jgi:glycerophosphoryl diester phosphodiesterase